MNTPVSTMNNHKQACYIGNMLVNDDCGIYFRGKTWKQCTFGECNENIEQHLSTLKLSASVTSMCPNANEKWLIQNRLKLENISDNDTICGKHRSKYGIGYKGPNTCCYPKCERKSKDKNPHVITVEHLIEINELFSSLANCVKLPLGSTWCSTCRLRSHSK